MFGPPSDARPIARLNGFIRAADVRTNSLTGRAFWRFRVETAGFEADVCMPADERAELPHDGNILAATVYMIGSIEQWTPQASASNSWLSRIRGGRSQAGG